MSDSTSQSKAPRGALWCVGLAPILASMIGSAFNIWYNLTHVQPLLSAWQNALFQNAIGRYNAAVYPVAGALWVGYVLSLRRALRGELDGTPLMRARARAINLPWAFALLLAVCWLGCVPYFLHALGGSTAPLHPDLPFHLATSVAVAALITLTHAVFILEILTQRLLFPALFRDANPAETPGAFTLTLGRRGLLWAISAGVCPIVSILLIVAADRGQHHAADAFLYAVGGLGIAFGLLSAWMLSRIVLTPVRVLREAAAAVAAGRLDARVDLLRADEFGPLIAQFNTMVEAMRAKQRLRETFGLHVGEAAARQILSADPGLGGARRPITALFCDIRGFTARCDGREAEDVVAELNRFFNEAVRVVESDHGGMINKFLGDGFMALFGATGEDSTAHALDAVRAAEQLVGAVERLNRDAPATAPLAIGIGIHTGPAVVGNIGSDRRLEFTAIGDTVNVASRLEALTKTLGVSIVLSAGTRAALPDDLPLAALEPQTLRGKAEPTAIYTTPQRTESR